MAEERTRQVQLQIYLMKKDVTTPGGAIREATDLVVSRRLPSPLDGFLLTRQSITGKPKWVGFLEEGLNEPLDELKTSSASALLVLKAAGRVFAVTYGYSKSALEPSRIERRFGLKVALNAIDAAQLRAVDSRTVEEMTLSTRRQASRTSEVSSFGLDTSRDLLRGVTGTPRDSSLGSRISGAESVTISAATTLADLPEMCARLLEVYAGQEYKERFSWIDHLQLVADPVVLTMLDQTLSESLACGDTERMHLAPPEVLDWQNVSGFYYWEPAKSTRHDELDIDNALQELAQHATGPITADYLRRQHLWVEFREGQSVPSYTLYSALVFEAELSGRLYVLSDGDWHEVDLNWAKSVRKQVASINTSGLALPAAHHGEVEKDYNQRAAAELGALLMDRCIVRFGEGGDQFEFCDILTGRRQLVHIKRKTQSATLSHLFMQGQNSALLLAHDSSFRAAVQKVATKEGMDVTGLVPVDGALAKDYEVVFAVIAKPNAKWPNSLPFFSQLSLAGATKTLLGMGYAVSLALIPLEVA